MTMILRSCLGLMALCLVCQTGWAAEPYTPQIEPASNEGAQAIGSFRAAPETTIELVAAEPDLANPVAFAFDEQGRIYVCETFRQKKGVEDNRGHMNWLMDDLKAETVHDRRQYMLKHYPDQLQPWTAEHDRLRLLEDTNQDGKYETSHVFADGFNDLTAGTGAGVLIFDGNVYYTCIPRLWLLQDQDGDGRAESRKILADGFGVRFAFRGHDMHGLSLGPDGRIYFSLGDRGYNVLTAEGKVLKRPDTGAVFRCERDGSNLEVFAYGLRNPQELAFDDWGRLFTGDNNSDSGDQARWVYVAEGSDTGWRMYYQYLSDRGPWNRERMWYPFQADEKTTEVQPAYSLPPIANLGDGPSGLTSYYGVGLPERYRNHFFMADFRGQPANSGIRSFTNKPRGAGFELDDSHEYLWSILATDVDFGYDGRMYISDWVNGWDGLQKGRIYRQQPNDPALRAAGDEVAKLFQNGFRELKSAQLVDLLGHPDRRVRLRAQIELATRGDVQLLTEQLKSDKAPLVRRHAIWSLWEVARLGNRDQALQPLIALCSDPDAEIAAQACRVLGDCRYLPAADAVLACLQHDDARVNYHAIIALGAIGSETCMADVVRFAETKTPSDPVLRHAVVMAFTGLFERQIASGNKLEDLLSQATYSQPARLAVAVALRRLHHPRIADYVSDSDPFVQTEAARGINDELISPAMMALARQPVVDSTPAALAIRIVNANYRLGGPAAAERVVEIASTESLKDPWRKRAFEALLAWKSGTELDAVTGIYRLRAPKDAPFLKALVTTRLGRLMKGPANLRELAIKLSAQLKIEDVVPELEKTLASEEAGIAIRVAALQALDEVNPGVARKYVEQMLKSEHPELRMESVTIAVRQKLPNAGEVIRTALADGTMAEKQNAIANLAKLPASAAESELARLLEQFQQGSLDASVQLDVLNAAAKVTSPAIQQQLSKVEQQLENGTVMQKYAVALEGGDIERGRELFFGNAAASCRRCHFVNGDGGGVGPDLSEIAKQNPRSYLLESIVDPNAKIAKGFATELIITIEGKVISGIVKEETEETITLVKPLGEIVIIAKDDVEERAPGKSGMPADLTSQLTRAEIRDLVAYLATLTEKKVSTDHGKEQ